jgi:hypothetical protein
MMHVRYIAGPGRRTPQTILILSERNQYLRAAAKFFPGMSDYEKARQLHIALLRYSAGAWRRDRTETTCPARHRDRLSGVLWMILKTKDAIPGERTIRSALAIEQRQPSLLIQN